MDQKLTPRQRKAARLLGVGSTHTDAARKVGVCQETITNWLRIPEFRALRDALCDEHVRDVIPEAVNVLVEQMRETDDKKAWLRQNAAGRLLARADAAQQQADQTINILVTGGMMRPGLPGDITDDCPQIPE